MPPHFFTSQENIPPGLGFSLYGPGHLLWLAGLSLGIVLLCRLYRTLDRPARRRLAVGLCLCALGLDLSWDLILLATGQFTLNYLPFDLCGLAMFAELLWALRPGPLIGELCWCLFLPGAAAALLFPNWTPLPFWNFLYLRSFLLHGILAAVPVMAAAGGDIRPDPRRLPKCFAVSLGLCVPVYVIDRLLHQNFFFLTEPSPGSPLELFAAWWGEPGYLLGLPLLLGAVWVLLYLPPALRKRRRRGVRTPGGPS